MKRVLITGAGSYVGTKVRERLERQPEFFEVDELDVRDSVWREFDFSGYDCVYHVAGIAHVSTDSKMESLYMSVNRDLAIEVGKKAKQSGVRQFIFMSSAIVYGDSDPYDVYRPITADTPVNPSNYYGLSKVEAEIGLMELASVDFRVAILRCPMIYGPGCRGNFPKLVRIAQRLPFFPLIDNRRSMLYVGNLVNLVVILIESRGSGFFLPQNAEQVSTSTLARLIAEESGRDVKLTSAFSPILLRALKSNEAFMKAFGNLYYDSKSSSSELGYQLISLKQSISETLCGEERL